jgi:hypothetical protein
MMSILVFDQPVIEKLKAVVVNAEIRDERGGLIGYFQPAVTPETVNQYECPFSEEELLAAEREGGGRPLADILSDLRNRS